MVAGATISKIAGRLCALAPQWAVGPGLDVRVRVLIDESRAGNDCCRAAKLPGTDAIALCKNACAIRLASHNNLRVARKPARKSKVTLSVGQILIGSLFNYQSCRTGQRVEDIGPNTLPAHND